MKKTGRIFYNEEVTSDNRKGKICLRCRLYMGQNKLCPTCENYTKCKLCGIIHRPERYRLSYRYKKKQFGESVEYVVKQRNLCRELYDGFCILCKDWKKYIKNTCWVCGDKFPNHFFYYKHNGNACPKCCKVKIEAFNVMVKNQRDFREKTNQHEINS